MDKNKKPFSKKVNKWKSKADKTIRGIKKGEITGSEAENALGEILGQGFELIKEKRDQSKK